MTDLSLLWPHRPSAVNNSNLLTSGGTGNPDSLVTPVKQISSNQSVARSMTVPPVALESAARGSLNPSTGVDFIPRGPQYVRLNLIINVYDFFFLPFQQFV